MSEKTFSPNRAITREEFVTMASRFAQIEAGKNIFHDVSRSMWSYDAIISAITKGWIKGYANGTFCPKNNITRAEAVTVINRMLSRVPDAKVKKISIVKTFTDHAKTHWAYGQISEAATAHEYIRNENGTETWFVDENDTRLWIAVSDGYQCKGLLPMKLKRAFKRLMDRFIILIPKPSF